MPAARSMSACIQLVKGLDGAILQNKKLEHVFTFDGAFVKRMDIVDTGEDDDADDDEENGE